MVPQLAQPRHPLRSIAVLLIAFLTTIAHPLAAQQPGAKSDNPAWAYERAYQQLDVDLSKDDWAVLEAFRVQGGMPSAEVRGILRQAEPMLREVMAASRFGYADFDVIDGRLGTHRVSHSSKLNRFATWLDADAKLRLADGNAPAAADRIAAMYRMMTHAADERMYTSSLMSGKLSMHADLAMANVIDQSAFGPSEAATLLGVFDSIQLDDPFQLTQNLQAEQEWVRHRLDVYAAGEADPDRGLLWQTVGWTPQAVPGLEDLSEAQTVQEIHSYVDLLGEFARINESDDPQWIEQELARLDEEAAAGQLGLIAQHAVPSYIKTINWLQEAEADLQARQAQLKELFHGTSDQLDTANAAIWYRRGIQQLRGAEPEWTDLIVSFLNERESTTIDFDQLNLIDRAAVDRAIEQFMQGSKIESCDFSTRRLHHERFFPTYADGTRCAFALMCIESQRLANAEQPDEALAHLAAAFRMASHLASDALILSAIESYDGYALALQSSQQLVEPMIAAGQTNPESLEELAAAIRSLSSTDPFSFEVAAKKVEPDIARTIKGYLSKHFDMPYNAVELTAAHERAQSRAGKWIASLDVSEQWYVMGVFALKHSFADRIRQQILDAARQSTRPVLSTITDLATIDESLVSDVCHNETLLTIILPEVDAMLELEKRMDDAHILERSGRAFADRLSELSINQGNVPYDHVAQDQSDAEPSALPIP